MVVAVIDAAVHDVILRHPPGAARRVAVDLTIATASSVIERTASHHTTSG